MKIQGLKPTHQCNKDSQMVYAEHKGVWYFAVPFSYDGSEWDWMRSCDFNGRDRDKVEIYLHKLT